MHWLRVLYVHALIGIQSDLQYRVNFINQIILSFLGLTLSLASVFVVFRHTEHIGGWGQADLIMLVGVFMLVRGGIGLFVRPGLQQFIEGIQSGEFDYVLLKPLDAQFYICIQYFRVWNLVDVGTGWGLIIWSIWGLGLAVTLDAFALFLLTLVAGFAVVTAFWLILATTTFWFIKVENIFVIFDSLFRTAKWPTTIYPDFMRILLTFVIPVAWAVTLPAATLTDRLNATTRWLAFLIPVGFGVAARLFWRWGIKHYSGASA